MHVVLEPLLVIHGKKGTLHVQMKAIHECSIRLYTFVNDQTWVGSRCPIHNSKCSQEDQYKFGWVIKELRDLKQINDKNGQSSSRCNWFGVWGRFLQATSSICKIYTNPYTYYLQINIKQTRACIHLLQARTHYNLHRKKERERREEYNEKWIPSHHLLHPSMHHLSFFSEQLNFTLQD